MSAGDVPAPRLYRDWRLSERRAHLMQEFEDLAVGPVDRRFVVRNTQIGAVRAHDFVRLADVTARHRREEVVLDLVVQASVEEVGHGVRAYVARGEDLRAQ